MTWNLPRLAKTRTTRRSKRLSDKLRLFVEGLEARELPAGYPAAFTPGDIVVYRAGDGSASSNANANPVFLDEYKSDGTLVQSIPMPTVATSTPGVNKALTSTTNATSEGQLN